MKNFVLNANLMIRISILVLFCSTPSVTCAVDLAELSEFASRWLDNCTEINYWCEGADIDTSEKVDLLDFARFANEGLADFHADYYVAANGNDSNPGTGAIAFMQWPEFPEWVSPIDSDTAQRVKSNAGIEPTYIDIKD